jgi:hypothetical protein
MYQSAAFRRNDLVDDILFKQIQNHRRASSKGKFSPMRYASRTCRSSVPAFVD